jgi:ubiquinone/menaquinone biosynthesis C-methylase UbiE
MEKTDDTRNRVYYDDFSGWYERERGRGYHAMLDDLELDAVSAYARHKHVLEVGCGTGLVLSRLKESTRSARGLDVSPGMVRVAKERGLEVVLGSATAIPFADQSFDLTCSFKVLAHIPDLGRAVAEMARVTRIGGHVAIELYNPWSLRYLAKRLAGPQPISEGRTEADVYTRWDPPTVFPKILPPGMKVVELRGIRVLTPAAFVHKIPVVGSGLAWAEKHAARSPLRWVGGFVVAIARREA